LLTGLKLSLGELSQGIPSNSLFSNSAELLDQSLVRLREISLNLVPRELETEGLHAAIESLADRINESKSIRVYYTASFPDKNLDSEKAMLVFRVVQELITNAIKHSGASKIEIGIARNSNRFIVEVRDDGKGFDYETALKKKKSSGLKNIQSRLDLLNTVLIVQSDTGKGTHYFINIPLTQLTNGNK
jgi:two-component system NarL family sensor kinase